MSSLPPTLKKIALFFERLPGIGEKTANRLAFYLLRLPERDLKEFGDEVINMKARIKLCQICLNFTEEDICEIDSDKSRDHGVITIVEDVSDLLSFETGDIYKGVYHVLHGRIDPLNNIRPEDIYIEKLLERVKTASAKATAVKEIILATNPDMEGEATAMYIKNRLAELQKKLKLDFKMTRLAYGLPIGASLEYADYMTLKKAMEGRNKF